MPIFKRLGGDEASPLASKGSGGCPYYADFEVGEKLGFFSDAALCLELPVLTRGISHPLRKSQGFSGGALCYPVPVCDQRPRTCI